MDMRYFWIRDKETHKEFLVYWRPRTNNLVDYFSKHHHAIVHRRNGGKYLHISQA